MCSCPTNCKIQFSHTEWKNKRKAMIKTEKFIIHLFEKKKKKKLGFFRINLVCASFCTTTHAAVIITSFYLIHTHIHNSIYLYLKSILPIPLAFKMTHGIIYTFLSPFTSIHLLWMSYNSFKKSAMYMSSYLVPIKLLSTAWKLFYYMWQKRKIKVENMSRWSLNICEKDDHHT